MHIANSIQGVFTRLAGFIARLRRRSDFTCGDCERSDRCSLPPSEFCIERAPQLERGDWKWKKRLNPW